VVKVDTDGDSIARGQQLRIRTTISVFEPLIRGFNLKKSKEDNTGTWYDFYYEKVPHFCFDCGRLVHAGGVCVPPLDSSDQWGSWLRFSPGRNGSFKEGSFGAKAASSSNSYTNSKSGDGGKGHQEHQRARDIPTKRNLEAEFATFSGSRTGGRLEHDGVEINSPVKSGTGLGGRRDKDLRDSLEKRREKDLREKLVLKSQQRRNGDESINRADNKGKANVYNEGVVHAAENQQYRSRRGEYYSEPGIYERSNMHDERGRRKGYYVRKPRQNFDQQQRDTSYSQREFESRKRGPKQIWRVKDDNNRLGGDDGFIRDTRRKTSSVFDRIEEQKVAMADPVNQGRQEQ
jgi:hypothetical protein